MPTDITLTPQPVRVTTTGLQPIFLSADIGAFAALDMEVVCAVEGTAASAAVNLYTGMQTQTDDGWVLAGTFPAISGSGQVASRITLASGLLRYLRWNVSSLGGATSLTFSIRGIGRTSLVVANSVGVQQLADINWSPVALATAKSSAFTTTNGSFTEGTGWQFLRPCTISGCRFYWPGTATKSVKTSLWDLSGTRQGTQTISASSAGVYTTSFTPVVLGVADTYKTWLTTMWVTDGSFYVNAPLTSLPTAYPSTNVFTGAADAVAFTGWGAGWSPVFSAGPSIVFSAYASGAAGDAAPNSYQGAILIPIEPIFTVP